MVKQRRTVKVSPETLIKLKKIQGNLMAQTGKEVPLPELIERMTKTPSFTDVEKEILKINQGDVGLRFD